MRELKVPYALDADGAVVAALTAPKSGTYSCLECEQRLSLRRSRKDRPYFSHLPYALAVCRGESAVHLAAKHLLREQLAQELAEQGGVTYHLRCPGVNERCRDHATHVHRVEVAAWDAVELEVAHGDFRFDVAVTHDDQAVLGFEVFFRHEVPQHKAEALDVPWLELLAEDLLAYRPRVPHRSPAEARRCAACEGLAARLAERSSDDEKRDEVSTEFAAEASRVASALEAVLRRARGRP